MLNVAVAAGILLYVVVNSPTGSLLIQSLLFVVGACIARPERLHRPVGRSSGRSAGPRSRCPRNASNQLAVTKRGPSQSWVAAAGALVRCCDDPLSTDVTRSIARGWRPDGCAPSPCSTHAHGAPGGLCSARFCLVVAMTDSALPDPGRLSRCFGAGVLLANVDDRISCAKLLVFATSV